MDNEQTGCPPSCLNHSCKGRGARSGAPGGFARLLLMSNARKELLTLLAQVSFKLGQFKLSSGGTSDYYIDCRTTTLHAEGAYLSGRVFLDEIRGRGWNPVAIGGLTMGADPIVCSVAILSGQEAHKTLGKDPTLRANSGREEWGTQGHHETLRHG